MQRRQALIYFLSPRHCFEMVKFLLILLCISVVLSGVCGMQPVLGYQVARATLQVERSGEPLRISGDANTFGQSLASHLPLRLSRGDALQFWVELEPFATAPEQAFFLLFNEHTGVQHALTANVRRENTIGFRFSPAEHLVQEPYLVEDSFATLVVIAGSARDEAPLVWSLEAPPGQRSADRRSATLKVDLRPTPVPERPGIFERNFTVHWGPRPEFAVQYSHSTPKTYPLVAGLCTATVVAAGFAWCALAFAQGLLVTPWALDASLGTHALAWQLCLGSALAMLVMFFTKWNLMQTLGYLGFAMPFWTVSGFLVLRRRAAAAAATRRAL